MYIHLGMGVVVREEDVVGIFDMENTTVSGATRDFLKRAQKENLVEDVCYDLPRSIVVCRDYIGGERVYITQIAPATLPRGDRRHCAETARQGTVTERIFIYAVFRHSYLSVLQKACQPCSHVEIEA